MIVQQIETFLNYFESIRGRTLRVITAIPPEHIEWRPGAGKFSFGDIIRHLGGIERYMYAENVKLNPSRYPGHGKELSLGFSSDVAYLAEMHRQSLEIFATLGDDDLQKKCFTPAGNAITVWKWLRAMIEHEVHHRGQVYLMLGLLDIPSPPLYGLTSEQLRAASRPPEGPAKED